MTTYSDKIYAIVRTEGTDELTFLSAPIQINREPSDVELRKMYNYSPELSAPHADCLCYMPPKYPLNIIAKRIRKEAIAFRESLINVRRENDVVAYSHRYGGWTTIKWQYNEDIKFCVDTNFGYGLSSYMSVRFYYKGLQLTPYSNYIHYRYANYSDVIRYTYEYSLIYSEWEYLMKDTLSFYNAVTRHQEHEVFNWLKTHLSNLISGLDNLKNATSSYRIYSSKRKIEDIVSGDELVLLKTEKIVGSYKFIENMQLLPTEVSPCHYIVSIKRILNDFKPQLLQYCQQYKKEQKELEAKINEISSIPDVIIYDRIVKRHGIIHPGYAASYNMKKFRIYLRIRNFIAPTISVKELKERYIRISGKIEDREKLMSRKATVDKINRKLDEALAEIASMEI